MYPYSYLPKPSSATEFYILLVLAGSPLHRYAIKGAVANASLGSVLLKDGKLYPLLERLCEEGLVDMIRRAPAGKSGKERQYYGISGHGKIRLQEEAQRLGYAVEIMKGLGLFENTVPTDIQRLVLDAKTLPEA